MNRRKNSKVFAQSAWWGRVSETIKVFALLGTSVPKEIQEAFDALGEDLDEMVATAPDEFVIQA